MVCYICKSGASLECRSCHRWICIEHEVRDRSCSRCVAAQDEHRREVLRIQQMKIDAASWCDFCQASTNVRSRRCAKCGRRFCVKHGQRVTQGEFSWIRCCDHLEFANIVGDHTSGPGVYNVVGCLLLPLGYVGLAGVALSCFARKPDYCVAEGGSGLVPTRHTYEFAGWNGWGEVRTGSIVIDD